MHKGADITGTNITNMVLSLKNSHIAFAILFLLACCFSYAIPFLPPESTGLHYILLQLGLTSLMVWAWLRNDLSLKSLLIIGLVARIILIPSCSYTSSDSERYLWDGAVLLAGLDPYQTTPDMDVSQDLRAIWPTPEEHSQYATVYPPGALIIFALSAIAGPTYGFFVWKIILTCASLAALFLMKDLATRLKASRHFSLFALSPLLIMEVGVGAHLDGLMVLFIVLTLWFLNRQQLIKAGIAIGLGASVKFIPLLMLGPLLFSIGILKTIRILIGTAATLLFIYGAIYISGSVPIGALAVFFEKWRGGSPLFSFLEQRLSTEILWLVLSFIGAVLFSIAAFFAKKQNLILALMITLSVPMIISPILLPWYLLVLTPFMALAPTVTVFLWLTTIPFAYEVLNLWISENIWYQASWPLWVTASIIPIGIFFDALRKNPKKINLVS